MINDIWKKDRKIAYFSMEIGHDPKMPNYAGGLGILAGDTLKSCADLNVPLVAVTLLSEEGFFHQRLDAQGNQSEEPERWKVSDVLEPLPDRAVIRLRGRNIVVKGWITYIQGITGFEVPVIYLDTDCPENGEWDRGITKRLYNSDREYRISQEVVLGIAGYRMLKVMGYKGLERYHLNEGHGSFLIVERINNTKVHSHESKPIMERYDFHNLKKKIVFTTHTPVEAGHDSFDPGQVKEILGDSINGELVDHLVHNGMFNMTHVALDNSKYVNGVAKKHAEVSRKMFPEHPISSITNGVHSVSWVSGHLKPVFDRYIKDWFWDPSSFRFAKLIPDDELWSAHMEAKRELVEFTNSSCGTSLSPDVFTLGFARRSTPYKRMTLMFSNIDWLKKISADVGKIQIILAGKAHPNDGGGKDLIRRVFEIKSQLKGSIEVAYIENYDIGVAKKMVAGVDVWLNTPQRPLEASGTSGMKAAHNGVPQLSTLDGWWIEGCIEDTTGWAIGGLKDEDDANDFYNKLEKNIVHKFYNDRTAWIRIMKNAIAFNASYFNTHRMIKEYVLQGYFI
ncbi:MAG: alpha-glucan family phosphorylase [Candidatus Woesearchaeota archaeon]